MRAFLICVSLLIAALLVPITGNTTPSPPQMECPEITMETPSAIICPDAEVTFTAGVLGVDANAPLAYHWTVSAGRIISGQGTPTITVATVNASADIEMGLRATVEVVGGQWGSCSRTASHSVQVKAFCPDRKFDQFLGTASLEEERARLGNFAARLRGEQHTMGLITLRSGGKMVGGEAAERLERARKYLVDELGIEMNRVYTREGDGLEELTIELWVMPTNPHAPSGNNSMPSP